MSMKSPVGLVRRELSKHFVTHFFFYRSGRLPDWHCHVSIAVISFALYKSDDIVYKVSVSCEIK